MAASGFTPIQLYHSTTAAAAPTAGNLNSGELAININDGKLFYKDSGGTVQTIATKDAAAGNFTTVDTTNLEVTNIKAKDGTAAASIADSTGVVTVTAAPVMSALTASQAVFTTAGKALTSNPITGTGNVVMSASPTLTGTVAAAAVTLSSDLTLSGGTANGVLYLNGSKVATSGSALTFDGSQLVINSLGEQLKLTRTSVGSGTLNIGGSGELAYASGFHIWFNAAKSTEWMRLDTSGNLRLGTTSSLSAADRLTVVGGNIAVQRTSGITTFMGDNTQDGYAGTVTNHAFALLTNSTERARITSGGALLVGTTTTTNNIRLDEKVAIVGVNVPYNGMALTGYTGTGNAAYRPVIDFNRSRGTTDGSMTVLANNDYLGSIIFRGSDGTSFQDSAMISSEVDGTPGAGDMPGRLTFWTSPDGSASVTERMRLDSSGNLGLGVTPSNWGAVYKVLTAGNSGEYISVWGSSNGDGGANSYGQAGIANNITQGSKYAGTGTASYYVQSGGRHSWWYSASGTGGNSITGWTQAMTLDASGNLSVGTTSSGGKITAAVANNASFQTAASFTNATNADFNVRIQTSLTDIGCSTATPLTFSTANTERARITSGGDLLVNRTSQVSGEKLSVKGEIRAGNISSDNTLYLGVDSSNAYIGTNVSGFGLKFEVNGAERARIDSSGRFLVGTTSASIGAVNCAMALDATTVNSGFGFGINGNASNTQVMRFAYAGTAVGSIVVGTSTTSYNTSSDYRLKENIQPMTGALAKVAALKPVTYTWKADGSAGEGFIAHELAEVCPAAVTGEKDAVDADGKPQYQGIDVSFLVGTLTAALQEAHGLIKDLQARVDALEAK